MAEATKNSGTDTSTATAATAATTDPQAAPRRKNWLRRTLLVVGPVLVVAGSLYAYVSTGRYAETDNAYVKANIIIVSPEIAGIINAVHVRENQHVAVGDVLFTIDDSGYRVSLTRAEAQLQAVAAMLEGQRVAYSQKLTELELAQTNVAFRERELEREAALYEQKLGLETDVDDAQHEYDIARQQTRIIEQSIEQLRLQLGGDPNASVINHAGYRAMRAARDTAALDVDHTVVRAPFDGIASKVPLAGRYVAPGAAVMSIVADHDFWIEANYKETDLTLVSTGQAVTVHIDTYPDREWTGTVASIGQATGSEFSVIPAQNATGNWVKVTQRIPVRIAIDAESSDPMLRAGMSAEVAIDTERQRHLRDLLGNKARSQSNDGGPANR
jgi:membrane fusion protein (multidrug efflux system)